MCVPNSRVLISRAKWLQGERLRHALACQMRSQRHQTLQPSEDLFDLHLNDRCEHIRLPRRETMRLRIQR